MTVGLLHHVSKHANRRLNVSTAVQCEPNSDLRSVTCHGRSHATRHRWSCLALTSARQIGTRFTYFVVELGVSYIARWFTCSQTVTHTSCNYAGGVA